MGVFFLTATFRLAAFFLAEHKTAVIEALAGFGECGEMSQDDVEDLVLSLCGQPRGERRIVLPTMKREWVKWNLSYSPTLSSRADNLFPPVFRTKRLKHMSSAPHILEPSTSRELVLLGTGTSVGVPVIGCDCEVCQSTNPRDNHTRSGALIRGPEGNVVIDTSPEIRIQLLREKVGAVHAAVFTHSHADHIMGLDDLRIFGHRQDMSLPLFCEQPTEQQIRESFNYAFIEPDPAMHKFALPRLHFERIGLEPFATCGVLLKPIRLIHGQRPILGFRINDVAFCTDVSHIPDESWPLLEGLDVLVIDALRERPHPTHFSVGQALEVVERVQPKRTYFTHLSHSLGYEQTNAQLPSGVELAYDGLRIAYG